MMLYVLYSLINTVAAFSSLVLIIPPVFYFLKTIASLCCAFYAFKIRETNPPYGQLEEGAVAE